MESARTSALIQFEEPGLMEDIQLLNREERLKMEPNTKDRSIEVERTEVHRKSDSSLVASTFIKYAAYIIIIFGLLFFLVRYVFPMF
jgi:hypothetical protein